MTLETESNEEKLKSFHISSLDEDEAPEEDVGDDVSNDDDDDDDDDDEKRVPVTLGFVEKPKNKWSLLRQYFPSKAGGTPAWLDPVNLPSGKSSLCDFCGEPLLFMLQIYAPLAEETAFHRMLFIFMCPSLTCLGKHQAEQCKRAPDTPSRSVKVFRCQFPRLNSFYSSESPVDDGSSQPLTAGALPCNWCGTWKGDKICGSCNRARYCSAEHQTAHWKSSKSSHKVYCRQSLTSGEASESAASNSLWPEYEIIIEDECEFTDAETLIDNGLANSLITGSQVDYSAGDLQPYFEGGDDDVRSYASFQERISLAPDQVLRYSRSAQAKPLWPMSSGQPSKLDILKCNYCGGPRCFEFQVLPQLLYFFHVKDSIGEDSLDWATIVVYTCEASCGKDVGYKEEFVWVQVQLPSQNLTLPPQTVL